MKKRLLLTLAATALAVGPLALPVTQFTQVQAVQQTQGQQLVALGGSLDAASQQQTLQLLGASQVPQSNIIYVDGSMINRYLQDGSGPGTIVYSSAYIQQMPEGYGVQVQIVTPQNITVVTPLTYQNAAITAGARNVQIRIATVSPVTGEGALTGVYALLEQSGIAVNTQDVQVAQQEINLVNQIEENAEISNDGANQVIAEVKTEVAQEIGSVDVDAQGDVTLTQEQITQIVNNVTINNNITNEVVIEQLTQYAMEFSKTEAAKSEDTVAQLDLSMIPAWKDRLAGLEGAVSPEEILAGERLDFSDQEIYHPILQAFADSFYSIVEEGTLVDNLYSDTFIYEMVAQEVSPEEKAALDQLRTAMYSYAANLDASIQSGELQPGYPSIKDEWTRKLQAWDDINTLDPTQAEIVRQLAVTSGRAPQVYDYINPTQEGTVITYDNSFVNIDHISDYTMYSYDVASGAMQELDAVTGVMIDLIPYNIGEKYGATLDYAYQPLTAIDPAYTIPGYVPVEETQEQVTEESQSVEETTVPVEETTVPVEETTVPVEETTVPVEESVDPDQTAESEATVEENTGE